MTEARQVDRPELGYWAVRLAAGGREVGAAIVRIQTSFEPGNPANQMERSPFLVGYLDGELVDAAEVWTMRGRPISAQKYAFLLQDVRWAQQHAPASSLAQPRRRVDLRDIPVSAI